MMRRRSRSAGRLLAALAGCLIVVVPAATAWSSSPSAARLGSAPALPANAQVIAPLPEAKQLQLTVALKSQDPDGLSSFATEVATPGSPLFHQYLTVAQFAQRFGATPAQIEAAQSALRAQGLSVGSPRANDLTLPVTGTAAQVEQAFSTSLSQVEMPSGRVAYANAQAPLIPSSAAPYVEGVIGLDDLALNQPQQAMSPPPALQPRSSLLESAAGEKTSSPQVVTGGPQPCQAAAAHQAIASGSNGLFVGYTADEIAAAYQFSSLYAAGDFGAGQTVAMLELEPYQPSDIATYQACYATSTPVSNVEVAGGPGPYKGQDGEAALDIEQVIGLAPKANILVYQGPNSANGTVEVLSAIVSQNTAKVISSSWGGCEPLTGAATMNAENTLLQEAAAQGQSFFASAGDSGSEECSRSEASKTELAALNPASQPFATGVGGTLLNYNPSSPASSPESLWNEGPYSSGGGGSGGGISIQWPMPAYQSGAAASLGVVNASSSATPCHASTDCREVPDVSASADSRFGYIVFSEGEWKVTGGTSAAAPLWAALTGLTNASPACRGIPIGFANPSLYKIAGSSYSSNFRDITTGSEWTHYATNDTLFAGTKPYPVTANYDLATGIGTPIGPSLAASLCALASPVYTVAIASPHTRKSVAKHHLKLQIKGSDSGGAALTYSATGLPAGLTINPATGLISGTPTKVGTAKVTVAAGDAFHNTGSVQFKWVVTKPGPLSISGVTLSGVSKHKPKLAFTVSARKHKPGIGAVSISLPKGLTLAGAAKALKRGVTVTGTKVKLKAGHGSLRIGLAKVLQKAKFKLANPALGVSGSLANKVKHGKLKSLTIKVAVTNSSHKTTKFTLTPKVS